MILENAGRELYPLPQRVAGYGNFEEFTRARAEDGQWVFWEDRVELVLAGRYDEVRPLHVELSPTYLCNFACPWCSCRAAREEWSADDVFHHPRATESTVVGEDRLLAILEHLAEDRVGIMWGGGEPTMHPSLFRAVKLADSFGLQQCLFTNGSLLNEQRARSLLEANLIFIRFSLDAVTPRVHEAFHDYNSSHCYSERVKSNLETAIRIRNEIHSAGLIGVSIVVDRRNQSDLLPTCTYIRSLAEKYIKAVDYVIIRPAYQFYTSRIQLEPGMTDQLANTLKVGGEIRKLLEDVGMQVIAPSASFPGRECAPSSHLGGPCRACGWFSEVTPKGDLLLCSDCYGNPDYFAGNISMSSFNEIWRGERRKDILQMTERKSCMSKECPKNGRGFHLNNIFAQIESLRQRGRIQQVRDWVNDLRRVLRRPPHPFFL